MMDKELWTTRDASEAWGLSEIRVRELCQRGRVKGALKTIQGANVVWCFPPQPAPEKRSAGRPAQKRSE